MRLRQFTSGVRAGVRWATASKKRVLLLAPLGLLLLGGSALAFFELSVTGSSSTTSQLGSVSSTPVQVSVTDLSASLQGASPGADPVPVEFGVTNPSPDQVTIDSVDIGVSATAGDSSPLSSSCSALLADSFRVTWPDGTSHLVGANGATYTFGAGEAPVLLPSGATAGGSGDPRGGNWPSGGDVYSSVTVPNGWYGQIWKATSPGGNTNGYPTIQFVDDGQDQSCLEGAQLTVTATVTGSQP